MARFDKHELKEFEDVILSTLVGAREVAEADENVVMPPPRCILWDRFACDQSTPMARVTFFATLVGLARRVLPMLQCDADVLNTYAYLKRSEDGTEMTVFCVIPVQKDSE